MAKPTTLVASEPSAHPEAPMLVGRALRRSVSPEDRERYERLRSEARRYNAGIAEERYGLGRTLNIISAEGLFRAGGYRTLQQFLEQELDIAPRTAYRAMRVAEVFPVEVARRYGMDKLEAILTYVEATPAEEKTEQILAIRIRVRDAQGRRVEKPIAQATNREIEAATAEVRRRNAARRERSLPSEVRELVRGLANRLKKLEGVGEIGIDAEVAPTGRTAGQVYLTFRRVPAAKLGEFKDVLGDVLSPKG